MPPQEVVERSAWHRGGMPATPDRDRDAAGRPLNARPRDAAGRPLARGAVGVERVPDDLLLPPEETVVEAQRLLDAGRPFHAHEVLEAAWKAAAPEEREVWRGLAQVAVGLTHLQRGNDRGAVALLRRGAEGLAAWLAGRVDPPPAGVDVGGVVRDAEELAARIEQGGAPAAPSVRLRP